MSVDGAPSTAWIVKVTTLGTDPRVTFTGCVVHRVTFRYVLFVTAKQWPSPGDPTTSMPETVGGEMANDAPRSRSPNTSAGSVRGGGSRTPGPDPLAVAPPSVFHGFIRAAIANVSPPRPAALETPRMIHPPTPIAYLGIYP